MGHEWFGCAGNPRRLFEILAAASAALIADIPMANFHGGEVTERGYDDVIRHALTKIAHLHFTAAGPYRARGIQMCEDLERVWCVVDCAADRGGHSSGQCAGAGTGLRCGDPKSGQPSWLRWSQ